MALPLPQARAAAASRNDTYTPGTPAGRVEDHTIAVDDGSIRVRLVFPGLVPGTTAGASPDSRAESAICYLHGGGWVFQDVDGFTPMAQRLAHGARAIVALADYRRAPEHPYPVPLDDCRAALHWFARQSCAKDLSLFIAGDSAGGNMAAALALESNAVPGGLAGQLLIYPAVDADFARTSYGEPENQTFLTAETMAWFWDQYVPDRDARTQSAVAPLRAGSHAGAPPAVVITAAHDVLRDEGEDYAHILAAAGVPVIHRRWPGQMHGFFHMVGMLPAAWAAVDWLAGHVVDSS
ncbi:alpha/beta hydrolase [Specibacter sp. NPDC078709]|uniref:alpha/beta hydrolase n=1 Tax=Specibacter sp. NPDC078709 TaxID=3154364 RepID=UPI003442BB3F